MTKVIIVHGTYGHPTENWIPWLKDELEDRGCQVIAPIFPTPENQNLLAWLKVWEACEPLLDDQTIVIGHSVGAAFLLSVLEKAVQPIKAAFLIGGFASQLTDLPAIHPLLATFVEKEFDWTAIRAHCRHFYIFHSDNDPNVPFAKAGELARQLKTEITIVPGAGHFNEKAGYTQFQLLLDRIDHLLELID